MRIVFLGTPREAAFILRQLHGAGHEVALVVSQPDRRRGRGGDPSPSPVKQAAVGLGLPVVTPQRAVEVVDDLRTSGADLGVVVAFGQILPVPVLDALPHGYVNVHFSLLPRWRGAAPVERAVLAGDDETGVCLMAVEEGLDTGGVFACERISVGEATAGELRERLTELGGRLLVEELDGIPGRDPVPQQGEPTYAEKLSPDEFELDWSRPAPELARTVRAGNPSPGAWTLAGSKRLKVHRAHTDPEQGEGPPGTLLNGGAVVTGDGVLVLDEVQAEGKQVTPGADWARGFRAGGRLLGR